MTSLPIWIKPNAGIPKLVKGKVVYETTEEEFAGFLPRLVEAGARFVGGCCGTDSSFIAALRRRLEQQNGNPVPEGTRDRLNGR
jgi:methionine synthase I (cobalamin-dependent)